MLSNMDTDRVLSPVVSSTDLDPVSTVFVNGVYTFVINIYPKRMALRPRQLRCLRRDSADNERHELLAERS